MIAAFKSYVRAFACLLALSGAVLFADRATAQSAADAGKIAVSLDPESRAVIERLSGLHELPDGTWKMHAGNLTHDEAVNLDESSWQPIATGNKAPNESVWFRQTFQVPETLNGYDLTGARTLIFLSAAGGMTCQGSRIERDRLKAESLGAPPLRLRSGQALAASFFLRLGWDSTICS
jgi:alpha-mannosidase